MLAKARGGRERSRESCFQMGATNERREMVKITLGLRTVMYLQAARKEAESDVLSHLSTRQAKRERDSKTGKCESPGVTETSARWAVN